MGQKAFFQEAEMVFGPPKQDSKGSDGSERMTYHVACWQERCGQIGLW